MMQGQVAQMESVLSTSVKSMDKQISQLEENASILFERLKSVRNQRPELATNAKEPPRAPKSPLADGLDCFSERIQRVREAISAVLQEIEL